MITRKTVVTFVFSALLVFALVACGGNEASLNTLKYLKGSVTHITPDAITIQTDDGQSYTFSLEGADMGQAPGLEPGVEVELAYTGTIDGQNTANTTLARVVAVPSGSVPASGSTPLASPSPG